MKRLVVVTNGNAFANLFLATTLARFRHEIAHVFVVTGIRGDAGRIRSIARYLNTSGPRYVGFKALTYAVPATMALTRRTPPAFVWQTTARLGIPTSFVTDPNAGMVRDALRDGPDRLLISVSCPMRIAPDVLEAAGLGAINVHSSLLPADAGLAPYIWVLARGARSTGVSVHVMEPRIDTGRILRAPCIEINPRTSALQLFLRQAAIGDTALTDVVEQTLREGQIPAGEPQNLAARSYHGMPTRAAIAELRSRGHRLVAAGDLGRLRAALCATAAEATSARS